MCVYVHSKGHAVEAQLRQCEKARDYVEVAKQTLLKAAEKGIKIVKWSIEHIDKAGAFVISVQLALKASRGELAYEDVQKAVIAYTILKMCGEGYRFIGEIEKEIEERYNAVEGEEIKEKKTLYSPLYEGKIRKN